MLEEFTSEELRERLGLETLKNGGPAIGPVAEAVRSCVRAWRSPARARVTAYLHRQLTAAGFEEEAVRARVGEVVTALVEVGDLTSVRLAGKSSLVLSRPQWISISAEDFVFLGQDDGKTLALQPTEGYVRRGVAHAEHVSPIDFATFMGAPAYLRHLARRTDSAVNGTLSEYWAILCAEVRHNGLPLDASQFRAVVDSPGTNQGRFGRHNQAIVSGRWKTIAPDGIWCAVRPGRHINEWHPILIEVVGHEILSLDLFDWDEWNWALLARGVASGTPERSAWSNGHLAFEHPVPEQHRRALRLLGQPGPLAWTWKISKGANAAFTAWHESTL